MVWIGVAPNRFLEPSRPALDATLNAFHERLKEPPVTQPALRAEHEHPERPEHPEDAAMEAGR